MEARQIAVEEDDVVPVDARLLKALLAIEGNVDGHARLAEATSDNIRQTLVILDDEHAHAPIVRGWLIRPT